MDTNIHSIWVEDEQTSKFHFNDPNVQYINSDKPFLSNKEHIELPPLPPSSFFSSLDSKPIDSKSKKSFIKAFKKLLSDDSDSKQPKKQQIRRKISTPFGFNHISHIDNKSDQINVSKLNELPKTEDQVEITRDPTKRVSTSAKAFCTSPQLTSPMKSSTTKPIPRSFSNATSLNTRSTSSQLFTRSGSISTLATSISSRPHSRKPSMVNQPQQQTQPQPSQPSQPQHGHQSSTSSIENLKKLEKNQIQKQTSIDYSSSNFKFPDNQINWGTPDPQSVSRQSWIYEESPNVASSNYSSPKSTSSPNNRSLKTSKSSPYNLNNFSSQLDNSFTSKHDMNELIQSMDDFTKFFKSSENPDEFDEDNLNETIASLRAAKHIRASRLSLHQDPKYLSFIEEFEKIKTNSTSSYTSDSTDGDLVLKELEGELNNEDSKLNEFELNKINKINEVEEIQSLNSNSNSELISESSPKQLLLPSVM
ncbi:Autophagy-related protein [Wickerhamomyces ciferrii]|uniref:Autophagy-related protein n=1 Tax=Wickerhamomyces ciferrii (strain ATCC 14091 / BCRC 22168 / CBS 111 / JCM 3599 / NBRC 0793 / NRRL Y-1031 F-60-10) TaxID=1206466 RepID=K0KTM7_WICCF|nr:Autophagy-related protein [Wickerhamomyces ciferrii]CCH46526.1 Autophagy-related protein [Wickerhamomyces ciferrii]